MAVAYMVSKVRTAIMDPSAVYTSMRLTMRAIVHRMMAARRFATPGTAAARSWFPLRPAPRPLQACDHADPHAPAPRILSRDQFPQIRTSCFANEQCCLSPSLDKLGPRVALQN